MTAYWRLMEHTDAYVKGKLDELPEFLRESSEAEIRAAAYPEEWATWQRGLDQLMELYGVPDGPESHESVVEGRETAPVLKLAPAPVYEQVELF